MSSPLVRRASRPEPDRTARYTALGLEDNPFPPTPSVAPESPDPRVNGTIYCATLHDDKRERFENILIPRPGSPEAKQLVFLMDHASSRGRGVGKTAFLNRRQLEISRDLGESASQGQEVVFALHVVPPPYPPCRKFWEFTRLVFERLVEREIILQAICRIRATFPGISNEVLSQAGPVEAWSDTVGNSLWLEERDVNVLFELNPYVRAQLTGGGVHDDCAGAWAEHGTSRSEMKKWIAKRGDAWWRRYGQRVLFDDAVRAARTAGFTRGLLLVDELEKIVREQNSAERRNFVEALRYYLIDGNCEAVRRKFYGVVLTIHPGIQELLLPHWKTAGLDRLVPLQEPDIRQNEISFGPLTDQQARMLVIEYLDHFRVAPERRGNLEPFTDGAITEARSKAQGVPGKLLNLLYNAVEKAADQQMGTIDEGTVQQLYDDLNARGMLRDVDGDALPAPRVIVGEKA